MKELDSFTVERLEKWIAAGEAAKDHHDGVRVDGECLAALATIALAAKRAEPVAWVVGDEEIADFKNGREVCVMRDCDDEKLDYLPLYTTPQLNSPEVRKLILSEVSDFCAGLGQPGEPELPEDIQQALMNRIELVFNNCG
ncbi:hypothetical protein [Yersinia aleksiciae]|uniref:hypothetical protein n=1 Tax=Yersinia aleksiciae TaxID=263819 RepID=UPI0011A5545E|nr:hypothetical protein [Yersinia aleksiciae]